MNEAGDLTVKLPHGLSKRIERVVEDSSLGFVSFDDFCLEAVRRQLGWAERTAYLLKEAAG